jgi:hypothetical protein
VLASWPYQMTTGLRPQLILSSIVSRYGSHRLKLALGFASFFYKV